MDNNIKTDADIVTAHTNAACETDDYKVSHTYDKHDAQSSTQRAHESPIPLRCRTETDEPQQRDDWVSPDETQQRDDWVSPDQMSPIDLVLSEIGENTNGYTLSQNEIIDDVCHKKQLTFEDVTKEEKTESRAATCTDPVYRYKVLNTVLLFWNVTTMGWVYGQMGPALPELQEIAGVPLQQATWLFTGFAIGYLVGCLLAGIIQDKFNPRLMLFLYTLGNAVTIGMLPWIPAFVGMVIIRVFNGIFIGGQDTGLHSMLFALWAKDGGPFLQMTHVLSALGGILSPLVTQPFVTEARDADDIISRVDGNHSYLLNTTIASANITTTTLTTTIEDTRIQYAFLITGVLTGSAALPFLITFLSKRRVAKTTRQYSNDSIDKRKLPKNVKYFILGVILTNSFIATANIDLFPSFLATFVLEQLDWTQQSASMLTSVYFATYAVGNFIGVFALKCISSSKLIAFSYIASVISLFGVLMSVIYGQTEAVWATVAVSGISMSAILPTLFTWTQENVTPITGRIASSLLISGSAGVMVNPLLLGYMMDMFSPMWFLYLSFGEIILCFLLFTTAYSLSRIFSSAGKPKPETEHVTASPDDIVGEALREEIVTETKTKTEIYSRGTLFGV